MQTAIHYFAASNAYGHLDAAVPDLQHPSLRATIVVFTARCPFNILD
jgi:hypothetical protein